MFTTGCCREVLPRAAAKSMVLVALVVAAATIAEAMLHTAGVAAVYGALVMGAAALVGGAILNPHARVPGLPSAVAGFMALAVYLSAALGPPTHSGAGGAVFVALLLGVTARSVRVALFATTILAAALVLASLT